MFNSIKIGGVADCPKMLLSVCFGLLNCSTLPVLRISVQIQGDMHHSSLRAEPNGSGGHRCFLETGVEVGQSDSDVF